MEWWDDVRIVPKRDASLVFLIKPLAIDMRKKFKEIIDRLSPVSEATVNCSTYLQLLFYGLLFWLQNTNSSGADVISKIYSSLARPGLNNALLLVAASM